MQHYRYATMNNYKLTNGNLSELFGYPDSKRKHIMKAPGLVGIKVDTNFDLVRSNSNFYIYPKESRLKVTQVLKKRTKTICVYLVKALR